MINKKFTKNLIDYYKKIDIFGTEINFNVLGYRETNSLFGSLLTTICVFIFLITFTLFGQNFYNKTNPKIIIENKKNNQYQLYNLNSKNFTFLFRIEDKDGGGLTHEYFKKDKYNDTKNTFYYLDIELLHRLYTYNISTGSYDINNKVLKPQMCNENIITDDYLRKTLNISSWLCFPFNDIESFTFGGSWSGEYVHHFNFAVHNRKINNTNNADMNEVNLFMRNNLRYFNYYAPYFNFKPNSVDNPFNIEYKVNYYYMNAGLLRIDRVYYKHHILQDDQGWIFEDILHDKKMTIDYITKDYDIVLYQDDPHLKYNIYSLKLYYDNDYFNYIRSYMKIQELAALVGGFMKFIYFVCYILIKHYNKFNIYYKLINVIYDSESFQTKKYDNITKLNTKLNNYFSNNVVKKFVNNKTNNITNINKKKADSADNNDNNDKISKEVDISSIVKLDNSSIKCIENDKLTSNLKKLIIENTKKKIIDDKNTNTDMSKANTNDINKFNNNILINTKNNKDNYKNTLCNKNIKQLDNFLKDKNKCEFLEIELLKHKNNHHNKIKSENYDNIKNCLNLNSDNLFIVTKSFNYSYTNKFKVSYINYIKYFYLCRYKYINNKENIPLIYKSFRYSYRLLENELDIVSYINRLGNIK